MSQRRKLTSSERHGVIALAVVMAIIVAIMAVDRGAFRPKAENVGESAASQQYSPQDTLTTANVEAQQGDSINSSDSSSDKKSRKRKKSEKKINKHHGGRQRNYLDESAE